MWIEADILGFVGILLVLVIALLVALLLNDSEETEKGRKMKGFDCRLCKKHVYAGNKSAAEGAICWPCDARVKNQDTTFSDLKKCDVCGHFQDVHKTIVENMGTVRERRLCIACWNKQHKVKGFVGGQQKEEEKKVGSKIELVDGKLECMTLTVDDLLTLDGVLEAKVNNAQVVYKQLLMGGRVFVSENELRALCVKVGEMVEATKTKLRDECIQEDLKGAM